MKKFNSLALFFRLPERGKVKTRLANSLGDELTLGLYKSFLKDTLSIIKEIEADKILVFSSGGNSFEQDFNELNDFKHYKSFNQKGSDLGERMYNTFDDIFSIGYTRCVLIGSDIPDLSREILNKSFLELEKKDVVIGPSLDGGYYLIGMNRAALNKEIFHEVPWSTSTVLFCTLRNLHELGFTPGLLPILQDIDDIEDLKNFYEKNSNTEVAPFTMNYILNNKGILNEKK